MSAQEITFTGEFVHSLDSQRRVAVPRQWRVEGLKYFLLPGQRWSSTVGSRVLLQRLFLNKIRKVSLTNAKIGRALALLGSEHKNAVVTSRVGFH